MPNADADVITIWRVFVALLFVAALIVGALLLATLRRNQVDRQRLIAILSGMEEGVVGIDAEGRVLFANDRAKSLLGKPSDFDAGRPLAEAVSLRPVLDLAERALASSEPHRAEFTFKSNTVSAYAARLPGDVGAVLVVNDVTELRALERMRQDFAANVNHELKTPLTVIKSTVENLEDGAMDDLSVRGEFIARIKSETDLLQALIQDLLRLSKIESGEMNLERVAIPVAAAVAKCLDRHAVRAEAKSQQLIELPPPEPLAVRADPESFVTILDNLIDNAIKYTNSGGKVTIRWSAANGTVTLEVQDTGIGIAERDLGRVFERFYRADKARSREAGGTGLGLAIVKHLAQAMRGSATVISVLGEGSTFSVTLPEA